MDTEQFKKKTDLIGKKLHLRTGIFIKEIPLIAQLVERRTVVPDQKFDSNPLVAGSNPAQCMQYCFLLNT